MFYRTCWSAELLILGWQLKFSHHAWFGILVYASSNAFHRWILKLKVLVCKFDPSVCFFSCIVEFPYYFSRDIYPYVFVNILFNIWIFCLWALRTLYLLICIILIIDLSLCIIFLMKEMCFCVPCSRSFLNLLSWRYVIEWSCILLSRKWRYRYDTWFHVPH